jgi:hypothetical protein
MTSGTPVCDRIRTTLGAKTLGVHAETILRYHSRQASGDQGSGGPRVRPPPPSTTQLSARQLNATPAPEAPRPRGALQRTDTVVAREVRFGKGDGVQHRVPKLTAPNRAVYWNAMSSTYTVAFGPVRVTSPLICISWLLGQLAANDAETATVIWNQVLT